MIFKLFNIQNIGQKRVIAEQLKEITEYCDEKANYHNDGETKWEKDHNEKCPNCGLKDIVNRIARVQGSGSVSGSFVWGSGSISGSSSSDTNEVNNCNSCSNQWKKYT